MKGEDQVDKELHESFINVKFPEEIVQLFKSILEKDEVHHDILSFIASKQKEKEKLSVLQLIENIETERRVKVQKKKTFHFEVQKTSIDRKSAERIVDKLASMSLLYYEYMTPYKMLFITFRGLQVLQALRQNKQIKTREEN